MQTSEADLNTKSAMRGSKLAAYIQAHYYFVFFFYVACKKSAWVCGINVYSQSKKLFVIVISYMQGS